MIDKVGQEIQWKRRLKLQRGITEDKVVEGEEIGVLSYKTLMSMGTENRIQVLCNGEPMIEIHQVSSGYIVIDVQGLEMQGIRVNLIPLNDQVIMEPGEGTPLRRTFLLD